MSSEISTDARTFRPWHLFVLAGLLASTVGVLVIRPNDPVVLVLLVAAIGSAAWVGFMLYRLLWPLAAPGFTDRTEVVGGRARAALEREKTLVLRAIKELEFDRAMSKVSAADFQEMGGRLRARAITLLQQLDVTPGYREAIEQELAQRLGSDAGGSPAAAGGPDDAPEGAPCPDCATANDHDARFCKACGAELEQPA
jgi:hypothetical protein